MLRLEDVIKRLETTERELRDVRSRLVSEPRPYDLQRGQKPNKLQVPIAPRTPSTGIADGEVWYDDTVNAYRGQASTQQFHFMSNLRAQGVPVFAGTYMGVDIREGAGITLTPSGNAIQIAATSGGGGAPINAPFVTISNTPSLSAERAATAGSLMALDDGGANTTFTFNSFDDYFVGGSRVGTALALDLRGSGYASLSGSYSAPRVIATVFVPSAIGDGAPGAAPNNAQYVVMATSATLSQERAIVAGSFMGLVDGGAGANLQLHAYPWTNYLVEASSVATAVAQDWYGRGYASLSGSYNPATGRSILSVFVPSMAGGAASGTFGDNWLVEGTLIATALTADFRGKGLASLSGSYSSALGQAIITQYVPTQNMAGIEFVMGHITSSIVATVQGYLQVPWNCAIQYWTVLANTAGSLILDVWRTTFPTHPPSTSDSIVGFCGTVGGKITGSGAASGWTTGLNRNDILAFNVKIGQTAILQATVALHVLKA